MKYIAHQRFRQRSISGDVNIPAQTECELVGNLIMWGGKPVCYATSYNGQQYFARNDDGNGMERGRLTRAIQRKLAEHGDDEAVHVDYSGDREHIETERPVTEHQKRWDKVWGDFACRRFKAEEDEDTWHWDHSFYHADIESLRHIAALVGADVKGD